MKQPNVHRAMQAPVTGNKRRKLLVLIAAFIDAGRCDPSVTELAQRSGLPRQAVVAIVDRLEKDGLLKVRPVAGGRNRYTLMLGANDGQ